MKHQQKRAQHATEINSKHFISVMADGATDAGGTENETVFCRFVQDGCPVNRLIGHKAVKHMHAEGKISYCLYLKVIVRAKVFYLTGTLSNRSGDDQYPIE